MHCVSVRGVVRSTQHSCSLFLISLTTYAQVPRLEKNATLEGEVALHPSVPIPTEGPTLKVKFEVVGLNVCGVSVAAVEADSDLQPRLVLRHVVRYARSSL